MKEFINDIWESKSDDFILGIVLVVILVLALLDGYKKK